MKNFMCHASLSLAVLLGLITSVTLGGGNRRPGGELSEVFSAPIGNTYGKLLLHFEANRGQAPSRVKFLSRGRDYTLFLTGDEALLSLEKSTTERDDVHNGRLKSAVRGRKSDARDLQRSKPALVRMRLVGAKRGPRVSGERLLRGKVNYFLGKDPGKWRTNVATYAQVRYQDVYPGIDLVYHGNQHELEYDFVVAPGADPTPITRAFEGVEAMELNASGDLLLSVEGGSVIHRRPVVYQEVAGERHAIEASYVILPGRPYHVGFALGEYDHSRPLVIDPALFYSTYLGGNGREEDMVVALDSAGNAYITGPTASTNFPTVNSVQGTFGGNKDTFVTKLNATGSAFVYSTYLGGSGIEHGRDIAVDSGGNAYVVGITYSTDFPTKNAIQPASGGRSDSFVAKLDPTGSVLVYSTYLGGSDDDDGDAIALDSTGSVFMTGNTVSNNFPTLNPIQPTFGGGIDGFVTKLNPTGSALVYSTYLGGNGEDLGRGIAVDSAGNAYVSGPTSSTNFPIRDPIQGVFGGVMDAFVTKLNASGSALLYSTYLGGSGLEVGYRIAVDGTGSAHVTGLTSSIDFPTFNPIQAFYGGGFSDAFVAKLRPDGSAFVYSTYLGGNERDDGLGISVDVNGNVYVGGFTSSQNFPTQNPIQAAHGGGFFDAFLAKLNPGGSAIVYSTYLGGDGDDLAFGIAVDSVGNAYAAGFTSSTDFPTKDPIQAAYQGAGDGFVAKIAASQPENQPPVARCGSLTVSAGPTCTAVASIDNGSFDPDGDPISIAATPAGPYPLGTTAVTLTVTDSKGAADSCLATVTVKDTSSPAITSLTPAPGLLWPPNHKMVPVTVDTSALDNCSVAVQCTIASVSSNEAVNGLGDGHTARDWEITGGLTVNLRAERSGTGTGRIYTIGVACTDNAGNNSANTATVTVPRDRR